MSTATPGPLTLRITNIINEAEVIDALNDTLHACAEAGAIDDTHDNSWEYVGHLSHASTALLKSAPELLAALKAIKAEADYVAKNGSDMARRGLPGIVWKKAQDAIDHAEGRG